MPAQPPERTQGGREAARRGHDGGDLQSPRNDQLAVALVPARDFRVDTVRREAEHGSANLVTNIFCENALETALQFRERAPGAKITALSYGAPTAEDSLRKALAMKADAAALVLNDGQQNPDPLTTARVLAAAIRKLGTFDLVMVGREAGDWGAGQTGGLVGGGVGLPR